MGISTPKILQHVTTHFTAHFFLIDYLPLPDFYQRQIWASIFFIFTSQQSSSSFNLVEVTLNGLCPIFHWTVFLSCEILDFYQRQIWASFFFLFTSQQSSSSFNLVEVTLDGLCPIFHWTVFLSCEILPKYVCPLFAKTVCKTVLTSHSELDSKL